MLFFKILRANISYSLLFRFLFSRLFSEIVLYIWSILMLLLKVIVLDEQSLATLQGRIQPNYLLLGKDTFHPHTGTLSSKTNLFPHRQGYSCLSPAPASTWDDPNLSEHDRTLCPKAIYQSLLSVLHACKVSALLYFHFLFSKGKRP